MFGQFYDQRDRSLKQGGTETQQSYAEELLAELLNRARVLETLMDHCRHLRREALEDRGLEDEYHDGMERTVQAVEVFLLDVHEARVRGRRARLFAEDEAGATSIDFVDTGLDSIGGTLVPWHGEDQPDERVLINDPQPVTS